MTDLADALRESNNPEFLLSVDFGGTMWNCAQRKIIIPNSGGHDVAFNKILKSVPSVTSTLDLSSIKYSVSNTSYTVVNNRFQDLETQMVLDGGRATLRVWAKGLDWSDVEEYGIIAEGVFYKKHHTRDEYAFDVLDGLATKFKTLPPATINDLTWPDHHSGVAGLPQQMVFGDWNKGIPLLRVDLSTGGQIYLISLGPCKSSNADYNAGTENIYDGEGNIISWANYDYDRIYDYQGNPVSVIDFSKEQSFIETLIEPLSCSVRGIMDHSGIYTGVTYDPIDHPADLVSYLINNHSSLGFDEIDVESIQTMRSLLAGARFRTIINQEANGLNVIDRFLRQVVCARMQRRGKLGIFTFDPDAIDILHIKDENLMSVPVFTKTPLTRLLTSLRVQYGYNPTTGNYEGDLVLNRNNNKTLKRAYADYGEHPQKTIELPDVGDEGMATFCASREIALYGVRHDIVQFDLPYWLGVDLLEGYGYPMTLRDAPHVTGNGWDEHKTILLEKHYLGDRIRTRWINPKMLEEAFALVPAVGTVDDPYQEVSAPPSVSGEGLFFGSIPLFFGSEPLVFEP
jgi:hypothetical protein